MILNCPTKTQQTDALVCLYRCPMRTKMKCAEYFKFYEKILEMNIEKKYLEKYGEPIIVLPNAMRKRRKRRSKAEMVRDRNISRCSDASEQD